MATLTALCCSSTMAAEKKPLEAASDKLTHPDKSIRPDYCWGVTIWSMIVHNVYGVQEDCRTIVVPPHANGRRLKLGKLELNYLSDTALTVRSAFDRKFRVTFPGRSGSIKVGCNGENLNIVVKDVPVPEVEFSGLQNQTYMVSME